jgi:DNA-directed RNA polymerase specialized sigma24 family protein
MDGGLEITSVDPVGDQVTLDELAKEVVAGLSEEGRLIARCKLAGMSDAKVGDLLGYSRATARERWQGVKEELAGALDGLEERQVLGVGKQINYLLAAGWENKDG